METRIDNDNNWCNHSISELSLAPNELIAMIIRGEKTLIPDGKTVIMENDVVVTYRE